MYAGTLVQFICTQIFNYATNCQWRSTATKWDTRAMRGQDTLSRGR